MATLSTLQCVTNSRNTGIANCLLDIKNIKMAIFCPPGYVLPAASMPNGGLLTQMQADTRNDAKSARIFPVSNFNDFKDNSEKPVEEKFGYGDVATVRDGIYDWALRLRIGGLDLSNRLRSFNDGGNYFLFVDSKNQLFGTAGVDATGAACIAAIPPIEFYQDVFTVNDGKKTSEYWSKYRFQPKFINELVAYSQDVEFDIASTILGLQDVVLSITADATKGVYHVTALAGAAKTNLINVSALASASAWTFLNAVTGVPITISSVAVGTGANVGSFTITVSTTAPPYPAGATKVSANLVGPTELAALLVPGYESTGAASVNAN